MGQRSGWLSRVLAVMASIVIVASACGSDDSSSSGDGSSSDAVSEPTGGSDSDDGETPGLGSAEIDDSGEIQRGGSITYGVEAETNAGWDLSRSSCPRSCLQVARTFFDPLAVVNADGEIEGYLLESFEFDSERSMWVLTLRPGIEFHNGEPFNAAAVVAHYENLLEPESIAAPSLSYVESVTAADELTVEVFVPPGEDGTPAPAAGFPGQLVTQTGLVRAPEMIDDPDGHLNPIGTGPYVFDEWLPNDHLTVVRNDSYWRDGEDGEPLPYLDEITFKPLPEGRASAVLSGTIDVMHSTEVADLEKFVDNDGFLLETSDTFAEPGYLMINQDSPPLDDVRIRRALALCIDMQTVVDVRSSGIPTVANGPYAPGSIGYLEDTGFPGFDPEEGKALIEEWEAENGPLRKLGFGTVAGNSALVTAQLYAQMLADCGIETDNRQTEFGELVESGQLGDFDILTWRFGGGPDPTSMYTFWHSSQARPVGESSVNFNRIRDDVIDENLDRMREASDPEELREAAEAINRRFGEQVYNIWTTWTLWGIAYSDRLHQVTKMGLPDGGEALPISEGNHFLTEAWVSE